jgi:hypothetical protein
MLNKRVPITSSASIPPLAYKLLKIESFLPFSGKNATIVSRFSCIFRDHKGVKGVMWAVLNLDGNFPSERE